MRPCRYCSGDASEPNHQARCDGRQGLLEFNPEAARAARDAAVERVEAHAEPDFMESALAAAYGVARQQAQFTTDDVWYRLGVDAPQAHERRAMGPVMMRARALGYVRPTSGIEQSAMVACHGRPKRVWQSLICQG
jgi:hypothetical protein